MSVRAGLGTAGIRRSLLLPVLFLVSGCAQARPTPIDPRSFEARLPQARREAVPAPALAWRGATSLTLAELRAAADETNPEIAAERKEIDVSTAAIWEARLYPNPTLLLEYEDFPVGSRSNGTSRVGVRVPLVIGDRLKAGSRAAEKEREVVALRFLWRRREILLGVRKAYIDLLAARRTRDAARESRDVARSLLDAAEARLAAQAAPEVEVLKSRIELSTAEAELEAAEASVSAAGRTLEASIGPASLAADRVVGELAPGYVVPTFQDLRAQIEGRSALEEIARAELAAAEAQVFVPKLDEGSIVINTVRFPGVSVDESVRIGTRIERLMLEQFPNEVARIWTRTGTPEVATDPMGLEVSDVFVMLRPRERWTAAKTREELEQRMRGVLKSLPGMAFSFTQPIEMRFNEMISGVRTDVGVKVFGDEYDVLKELATKVQTILAGVRGAAEPAVEPVAGQPVLEVTLDQEALSRHGLQAKDVLDLVEAAGGLEVGEIRTGQRRLPLSIRLPEKFVSNVDVFSTLIVPTPDGQRLPLKSLAKVERLSGPLVINREWGKRRVVVTTNVVGRDLGSFVSEASERIEEKLGDELRKRGCRIEFGGQYENLVRASKTLSYVVPIALLLILVLVYSTYGNVRDSLRVFTGVPFSLVGGVLALHFRHMPLSISAGVGFIALAGVSVLADMVMVSTIRQVLAQGVGVRQAVLTAAEQRLRPVLMTALVASLGFIPMAFNTGIGSEVQRPLATVVIGGLISSTILTLFVLPTLFAALRFRQRRAPSPPERPAPGQAPGTEPGVHEPSAAPPAATP